MALSCFDEECGMRTEQKAHEIFEYLLSKIIEKMDQNHTDMKSRFSNEQKKFFIATIERIFYRCGAINLITWDKM